MLIRQILLCCLAALFSPALVANESACGAEITLESLLTRNANAMGGVDTWQKIENVRYELVIREPGFEVTGRYWATRDGQMRIDIYADGDRVFTEALNHRRAWQWNKGAEVTTQGQAGEEALRHGIDMPGRFFTLQDVAGRGAEVVLEGCADIGDKSLWQVRVTLPDGFGKDHFLDPKSALVVVTRDVRAFHPDIDPTEVTVITGHERMEMTAFGVLASWRSEQSNGNTGEWLGTTEVQYIAHNRELPEGLFKPDFNPEDHDLR